MKKGIKEKVIICINGADKQFIEGLRILSAYANFEIAKKGIQLYAQKIEERKIIVKKEANRVTIFYHSRANFFYGFTAFLSHIKEENYYEEIACPLKDFGVLLDCSRNAVLRVDSLKDYVVYLACMGYTYLELYTEDTYEIKDEPYFGYMRGRYTQKEIQQLDAFAQIFGIELVPCIQTLAHLDCIFRYEKYKEINDVGNILLLRDERTYRLIEKMFEAVRQSFSSRRINIGLDEARLLGSGKFFDVNGYVSRSELMLEHLEKVLKIAKKYGFTVSLWNDMFFKAENGGEYRVENPIFSEELLAKIPKEAKLIYWDYINEEQNVYENMLKNSLRLTRNTGFAGGVRTWGTFTADIELATHKLVPAVNACRKYGIDDILVTLWGDDGSEASKFSALSGLCLYSEYVHKNSLMTADKPLRVLFNYSLEELKSLAFVNRYVELADMPPHCDFYGNTAKYMLYNDVFYGLYDNNVSSNAEKWSRENAKALKKYTRRKSRLSYLFKTMEALAKVLIYKSDLGIRVKEAYDKKDMEALRQLVERVKKTRNELKRFIELYETQWLKENKPFGLEVQHIRLGGLAKRLSYVQGRIESFIQGDISVIEELEENHIDNEHKYANGENICNFYVDEWKNIASCGRINYH